MACNESDSKIRLITVTLTNSHGINKINHCNRYRRGSTVGVTGEKRHKSASDWLSNMN